MTYEIKVSSRKNKKYDVYKNGKYLLSFGSLKNEKGEYYQHYKDTTPLKHYSHLDHGDKTRLNNFWKRHKKTNDKTSARYWLRFLW